jgi:hypothetical protein
LGDGPKRQQFFLLRVFLDSGESAQGRGHELDGTLAVPAFPLLLAPPLHVDALLDLLDLLVDLLLADVAALGEREGPLPVLRELRLAVLRGGLEVDEPIEVLDLPEESLVLLAAWGWEYVMEMKKLSSWCGSLALLASS